MPGHVDRWSDQQNIGTCERPCDVAEQFRQLAPPAATAFTHEGLTAAQNKDSSSEADLGGLLLDLTQSAGRVAISGMGSPRISDREFAGPKAGGHCQSGVPECMSQCNISHAGTSISTLTPGMQTERSSQGVLFGEGVSHGQNMGRSCLAATSATHLEKSKGRLAGAVMAGGIAREPTSILSTMDKTPASLLAMHGLEDQCSLLGQLAGNNVSMGRGDSRKVWTPKALQVATLGKKVAARQPEVKPRGGTLVQEGVKGDGGNRNTMEQCSRQGLLVQEVAGLGVQMCMSCLESKDPKEFPLTGVDVTDDHCRACLATAVAVQSLRSNHLLQAAAAHLTKVCGRCRVLKTLNQFHRDSNKNDGFRGRCKECEAITGATRRAKRVGVSAPTVESKRCRRCGLEKPAIDFPRKKERSDGLDSYCKACNCAATSERTQRKGPVLEPLVAFKVCGKCKEEKPARDFPPRKFSTTDGLYSYCRPCKKKLAMESRRTITGREASSEGPLSCPEPLPDAS